MSASVDCKEPTYLACKAKPTRVNPLTPKSIYFLLKISPLNHTQRLLVRIKLVIIKD